MTGTDHPDESLALAQQLSRLLENDDLDAAIEAGLPTFDVSRVPALPAPARLRLQEAQRRLAAAWEARARHQARNARLARRAEEREARRAGARQAAPSAPLPPAAAAALARARARARGDGA